MKQNYVQREKAHFLDRCTQCGVCAVKCPVIKQTGLKDLSPGKIQQAVYSFLEGGGPDETVYTRAFSCMECFKCTLDDCPQGLNPLMNNELVKNRYRDITEGGGEEAADPHLDHRILARLQTTSEEYKRITSPVNNGAKVLFFPGCNVYQQPEKLLNTLDILDLTGHSYSYLPGMVHCCGDRFMYAGDLENGIETKDSLLGTIEAYRPEVVLLWCPTCHCRLDRFKNEKALEGIRFMSVHDFILQNTDRLPFVKTGPESLTVTLHEACKSSYTGLDNDAPRKLLQKIPGLSLKEMAHCGKNTLCCGSGLASWFPQAFQKALDVRLEEADVSGAEKLVAVCHFCEQGFIGKESDHRSSVTNIINLLAESLGIHRTNKARDYVLSGDRNALTTGATWDLLCREHSGQVVSGALKKLFLN